MVVQAGRSVVIRPEAHKGTVAQPTKVGRRVEIQDSPEGSGRIFLSGSDPVELTGYAPGDLWMNTVTGTIFRMEA